VAAALALLARLGALEGGQLTALGRRMQPLPLHPRLARVLLDAPSRSTAAACAALAEGWRPAGTAATGDSDALAAADRLDSAPAGVRAVAAELTRLAGAGGAASSEDDLRRAIFNGYPDRLARRREPGSARLLLANGQGAALARESAVREAEFLVALEVHGVSRASAAAEALVRSASAVHREWIAPTRIETVHWLDDTGTVRAAERAFYDALPVGERGVPPEPEAAAEILAAELLRRPPEERNEQTLRRLRFAGVEIDLAGALRAAAAGRRSLFEWSLAELLPPEARRRLEREAPAELKLPSGRRARLEYREDGSVVAAVKLQELFGLGESPRLGARRETVTFSLLAPNGRPVQTTRDLKSFWNGAYQEVRRELRGRYPKHPWPDDPWTAPPTHRPIKRR
jgi:ATP-dependent helicase HrpB